MSPCPVSSQNTIPFKLSKDWRHSENYRNIYRKTTWIQCGTKQFLELELWGNCFVWLNCLCSSMQVYSENLLLSITTEAAPPPGQLHHWPKRVNKERERDWWLRTHWSSRGKMDFLRAFLSTFGGRKPVWRVYILHKEKHSLSLKLYWV